MATVATKLMTIEEFAQLSDPPDGSKLELVRGEIEVMPRPKGQHGIVCSRVDRRIGNYVEAHKLGWVASNDTGVILKRDPDTLRGPDVAFWSWARQPAEPEGYFEVPPDLVVEVLSPNDRRGAVRAKVKDYLSHDVRLVWLVDPDARTVTVYRGTGPGLELDEADTLDGGDVLPGFACKVADLFG